MEKSATDALLGWYDELARDLPWRNEKDPYRVLASEIMLQQTRCEVVKGRYADFISRFPDAAALAGASEDELMKAWEGMGYYSRARNLREACRRIVSRGGRVPGTKEELLELPGVGPYTAAAVLSIAYGKPEPALDANAVRVFCRLLAMEEPPRTASQRARLESEMRALMPEGRAADFTQAIMDLGQLVCAGRTPRCDACPLSPFCEGRRAGDPGRFPRREKVRARKEESWTAILLTDGDRLALEKRAAGGLLASMYAPPLFAGELGAQEVLRRVADLGFEASDEGEVPPWRHAFTHRIWNLSGRVVLVERAGEGAGLTWADPETLETSLALPSAFVPAAEGWKSWRKSRRTRSG